MRRSVAKIREGTGALAIKNSIFFPTQGDQACKISCIAKRHLFGSGEKEKEQLVLQIIAIGIIQAAGIMRYCNF